MSSSRRIRSNGTPGGTRDDPIWREELAAIFDGEKTMKDALKTVAQKAIDILGAR